MADTATQSRDSRESRILIVDDHPVMRAGLAAALGRTLLTRMRLSTIRRIGGTVCLLLAAYTALEVAGVR